jgi:hypothetical protein
MERRIFSKWYIGGLGWTLTNCTRETVKQNRQTTENTAMCQHLHEDFGDEPGIEERIPEGWDYFQRRQEKRASELLRRAIRAASRTEARIMNQPDTDYEPGEVPW